MSGRITGLKFDRGFGFITTEDGREHFFHASAVRGVPFHWLKEGMRVTFHTANDYRGPRAYHVQEAA